MMKEGDGLLDMDELAIWESGLFHTEAVPWQQNR